MRGSPSRTPSTPFFAIRIASAPISSARSAAAVSVVKYGLPVPAAKITTRPFSRWRTARRRMYGSATSCIVDRRQDARVGAVPLERLLDRERVQDGREHAHVVAGGAVDALRRGRHAAVDVAAADHERELEPVRAHVDELRRELVDGAGVEAVLPPAHQGLAGELQQDAVEAHRGRYATAYQA